MNKRQRGRGRKPNNPNRSLDSNGPDVKIRGSANTIYDKYTTLARDAASSGHRVKAENYLQHAEHYLRLVMEQQAKAAAHAEQQQQARQQSNPNAESEEDGESGQNQGGGRSRRYPPRRRSHQKSESDGQQENGSVGKTASDSNGKAETAKSDETEKPKTRRKKTEKPVVEKAGDESVSSAAE